MDRRRGLSRPGSLHLDPRGPNAPLGTWRHSHGVPLEREDLPRERHTPYPKTPSLQQTPPPRVLPSPAWGKGPFGPLPPSLGSCTQPTVNHRTGVHLRPGQRAYMSPSIVPTGGSAGAREFSSWIRQSNDFDRLVDGAMVEETNLDFYGGEDDVDTAGALLHMLSEPAKESPTVQQTGFSWKELEVSSKQLDAANIRITLIDLTCVDDTGAEQASDVAYNFSVEDHRKP